MYTLKLVIVMRGHGLYDAKNGQVYELWRCPAVRPDMVVFTVHREAETVEMSLLAVVGSLLVLGVI